MELKKINLPMQYSQMKDQILLVQKLPKDLMLRQKYTKKLVKIRGVPILKIETPKKGITKIAAGTMPIKVLKIAVTVRAVIISLSLIGAINKFVKFLLHISSRNIIL